MGYSGRCYRAADQRVGERYLFGRSTRWYKSILRVHRENYHSYRAIECELGWLEALDAAKIVTTPGYYVGKNGHPIQKARVKGLSEPRYLVLFHFVEGEAPDESGDMSGGFEELGAIAARCHDHVLSWQKPDNFERLTWDVDTVFGETPTWGDWRNAPEVDGTVKPVLERVEATIRSRLTDVWQGSDALQPDPCRYAARKLASRR